MAGYLQHLETGDVVALVQPPGHRMGRAGPEALLKAVDQRWVLKPGDPAGRLHRVRVAGTAQQRDSQFRADGVACALVVWVGVCQRVRRDRMTRDLPQDPAPRMAGSCVDQHIAREVDVDRVARTTVELEQSGCEFSHRFSTGHPLTDDGSDVACATLAAMPSARAEFLPEGPFELRAPADIEQPLLRLVAQRALARGRTDDGLKLALGIEGGGLATSMCAGMAWGLQQLGAVASFDAIYGVSSGGLIAAYAAAGRMDQAIELLPKTCTRDFVDLRRALTGRPVLSLDHLFRLVRAHPLGDGLIGGHPDLRIIVAGVDDGRRRTLRGFADMDELLLALRAGCAIPVISRETVEMNGDRLADGGLIESVPVGTPLAEGATHVLALRSRDASYRKGRRGRLYGTAEDLVINRLPGKVPEMIRERPARYDADADDLAAAQAGAGPLAGRVLQMSPAAGTPLVGRLETDAVKVRDAIRAGAAVVLDALARPAS